MFLKVIFILTIVYLILADPIGEPSKKPNVLCQIGEVTRPQENSTPETKVNNIINIIPAALNPIYILIAWLQNPNWYTL